MVLTIACAVSGILRVSFYPLAGLYEAQQNAAFMAFRLKKGFNAAGHLFFYCEAGLFYPAQRSNKK